MLSLLLLFCQYFYLDKLSFLFSSLIKKNTFMIFGLTCRNIEGCIIFNKLLFLEEEQTLDYCFQGPCCKKCQDESLLS